MYRVIVNCCVMIVCPDYDMALRSYNKYVEEHKNDRFPFTQVILEKDGRIIKNSDYDQQNEDKTDKRVPMSY